MTDSIPFSGLAPDTRRIRGGGEVSAFEVDRATELGRELRRSCAGAESTDRVAATLADMINAMDHDGRSAWVLVRVYVTRADAHLPCDVQLGEAALRLVSTRGVEPQWNEVESSHADERAARLASDAVPVLAELMDELRHGTSDAVAKTIPVATSQGARSIVAFGATPWIGETVLVVALCRAQLRRESAVAFETLALYTKAAWVDTGQARAELGETRHSLARTAVLDAIVAKHEAHIHHEALEMRRRLAEAAENARRVAETGAKQLESHNDNLRRTQRAMVNVIEDLREAREALASKVDERTRELAAANHLLEARNQELEEFVYIASHDLQEPLRTVAGYLQMIERRYASKLGVEGDEFIRFAIDGAQRMQALIESLLVYSRVATKDRELHTLDLDEALEAALRNLALRIEETHATIERSPLPQIRADRVQMTQLFQNLLANGLKFAGEAPPRIRVAGEVAAGMCTVTVRDEGIGFNPKYVDRIFKIFRRLRRDTEGTGIGLAVCKKIVERHGGRIEADSNPGAGSTFSIHLPTDLRTAS
jgi:signal transduction histidine kinase